MAINTPIYRGLAQSDLDMAGFDLLNWSGGGGGGGGTDRKFDVKTYGATGNGTTDDTTAIQAALAAIPAGGGVLYFPAGKYKYTGATLTLDRKITVEGDGGAAEETLNVFTDTAISTVNFNSSTLPLFTVTANGCTFKNLELYNSSGTPPTAGAGIVVTGGGDQNTYQNLTVNGFYIGIDTRSGSCQYWNNCFITASVLYGLKLTFPAFPDVGDHSISNCWIYGGKGRAATSAIRIESGGGVKIVNTKINAAPSSEWTNGVDIAVASGVVTSDLLVSNCSIENCAGYGIKGTNASGAVWYNWVITGNQIATYVGSSPYGIYLSPTNAGEFKGITITGNVGNVNSSPNPMIYIANCTEIAMIGNAQYGFSGGVVTFGSGVTFCNSPTYIGRDARLVSITGGAKLQVRNPGTDTWVDGDSWTNP